MNFNELSERYRKAFDVPDMKPEVHCLGVKFIQKGEKIPENIQVKDVPAPWCRILKLASEGDVMIATKDNIGCPAAGIALGLVDPHDREVLSGSRKYTSMMSKPASPKDFTDGFVYACKGSGHMEFALFGENDSGRYETWGAAKNAIQGMASVNEHQMDAVLAFPAGAVDIEPDVVIIDLIPKQVLRTVQGYAYPTGERVTFSTIGIRGVCADITAYPFIEQKMNASFYCLGARALGEWEGEHMALGMPLKIFKDTVEGMEASKGGFPYKAYP
jgi:uncharacterized protein (DUF169 family)